MVRQVNACASLGPMDDAPGIIHRCLSPIHGAKEARFSWSTRRINAGNQCAYSVRDASGI